MSFDPTRHLISLKGKQYLPIQARIMMLRDKHPNASIVTELVSISGEGPNEEAMFRAVVTIPDGGSATGYGTETRKDFPDFKEKSETKSIGRALAALGFGTQYALEFDEGGSFPETPSFSQSNTTNNGTTSAPPRAVPQPVTDEKSVAAKSIIAQKYQEMKRQGSGTGGQLTFADYNNLAIELGLPHHDKLDASILPDWLTFIADAITTIPIVENDTTPIIHTLIWRVNEADDLAQLDAVRTDALTLRERRALSSVDYERIDQFIESVKSEVGAVTA